MSATAILTSPEGGKLPAHFTIRTQADGANVSQVLREQAPASVDPEGLHALASTLGIWVHELAAGAGGFIQLRIGGDAIVEVVATSLVAGAFAQPIPIPLGGCADRWSGPRGSAAMIQLKRAGLRFGVSQHAFRGGYFCGDSWAIAEVPGGIVALVLDGLGHGPGAASAAAAGVEAFLAAPDQDPVKLADAIHQAMSGTCGGVGAVAFWSREAGALHYVAVGDITGRLLGPIGSQGLAANQGILGGRTPRFRAFHYAVNRGLLVLHTDGVRPLWTVDAYLGLQGRHPALIAALIHRDHGRATDDGSLLAVQLI